MYRTVLFLLICLTPAFAYEDPVAQAMVKLSVASAQYDYQKPWTVNSPRRSYGSGCVIAGNRIITNAHVVANARFIEVQRFNDAKKWQAQVQHVIHDADLALVTVDDPAFFDGITPLDLAINDLPEPQSDVLVHGFPRGGSGLSITKGVVSRVEPNRYAHSGLYLMAVQIDAPINPGNSGGPVSQDGKLIGVVMQGYQFSDGLGYMVPLQIIRHAMLDLQDGQHDGFPSLGIRYQYLESSSHKHALHLAESQTGSSSLML
jgi:S1-C subfamily serine protease